MARPSSKIMSIVEKKAAQAGLKLALKNHNENVKSISATLKDAEKTLALAKKSADAAIAKLNKEQAVVAKQAEAGVKAAQKAFDAAYAKTLKAQAAADKGTEKLTGQLAALDAVEAAPVVKAPTAKKAKAVADALV